MIYFRQGSEKYKTSLSQLPNPRLIDWSYDGGAALEQ
jgi:hypothetical protein